jgi:hypothetical protein
MTLPTIKDAGGGAEAPHTPQETQHEAPSAPASPSTRAPDDALDELERNMRAYYVASGREPDVQDIDCLAAADAIAALRARAERAEQAIEWALGEGDSNFRARQDNEGPYYWRHELIERARGTAIDQARGGTRDAVKDYVGPWSTGYLDELLADHDALAAQVEALENALEWCKTWMEEHPPGPDDSIDDWSVIMDGAELALTRPQAPEGNG